MRRRRRKRSSGLKTAGWINHADPLVSIIIPAMNEGRRIARVLREAAKVHPRSEIIVVVNGSTDNTAKVASRYGGKVIHFEEPLGHDVGRRKGAEAAKGGVLLFMDADIPIKAADLIPFVKSILQGTDVALNQYAGPVAGREAHPVVVAKHTLNAMLSRPDLGGASLTAVPHALSRRAIEQMGCDVLEVPPLALAKAVTAGLEVRAVHHVPVGRMNTRRPKFKGLDPLGSLVTGDHLEAVQWLLDEKGPRAGFTDLGRQRERVQHI